MCKINLFSSPPPILFTLVETPNVSYQHAKKMLNGRRVLFCTCNTNRAQCTQLIDHLTHVFVRDICFTHVFTHAKLASLALEAVKSNEHTARV